MPNSLPAINPYMKCGIDTLKSQSQLIVLESLWYVELSDVGTTLILCVWRMGRINEEWELDVGILGSAAETLQLPDSRYTNIAPF